MQLFHHNKIDGFSCSLRESGKCDISYLPIYEYTQSCTLHGGRATHSTNKKKGKEKKMIQIVPRAWEDMSGKWKLQDCKCPHQGLLSHTTSSHI
jgi:hypothetical protein